MCGFNKSTKRYTRGLLYPASVFKILYQMAEKAVAPEAPQEIAIFNGGSFWNEREIPSGFQDYVFHKVAEDEALKRVMIETRCDYITPAKLEKSLGILGEKKLKIAIGLESQNDAVRNKLIRKNLAKHAFEDSVSLAREYGTEVLAYVFLKPIGLDEKESLQEALSTIRYALAAGVSEIELSCAFVQEGTKMADAYHAGTFRPPYLWTILELIQEVINNNWPVSIGGFTDEPPPIAIPTNCPDCSTQIYDAIDQFRQTRTLGTIPGCSCKKEWECTQ